MKVDVYNLQGEKSSQMDLDEAVFDAKIKPEVVHEVFVCQNSNLRQPLAHTKDRSDVRGGGRKPWAQKGTGRARHGSSRSPIWRGGGVTFGPLNSRNFKKKINKKVRQLALKMCLTDRLQTGALKIIEDFKFEGAKTKLFANFLNKLPDKKNSNLVITVQDDGNVLRMTKNIPRIATIRVEDLSIVDVLNKQGVIISKEAVKKIEEKLTK